ncbi:MAG: hypothetical protein CMJ18_28300 [Phycisphaeraceae bacterium]|nr:hypothetical protein [Phycisphaeraceae bacterium]
MVQSYRQYYRGQMWHVVRDPTNNQFFRLNDAAYQFVAMLDGRRTVEAVWQACNEQLGDRAPTQVEAIQLLGQLYTSNLLASELPADAAGMFERYRKRVRREIGGYLQNFLFIRIPLIDPDAFLDRWVTVFGLAFTKVGFLLWAVLIGFGVNSIIGRFDELVASGSSENILDPSNLIWLYISMALIKGIHEFGHGFACKKFGHDAQSGGEVHTMGIMFLVFMPVPYVDASSSWALRSKWQRIIIAAGGMYVELAIAAIAAIVWSRTSPGITHSIAFNLMFIASVSTLLFNGNPLLRFDAYYILADLLEIANLSQRSKEYIYYLVKRYAYGFDKARNPSHSPGEKFWLLTYGLASVVYRVFICVGILMFVADKLFFLGSILAMGAVFAWVLKPMGKWFHYLFTSPELLRTRPRAIMVTVLFFVLLIGIIGLWPRPDYDRAPGIIEARDRALVVMAEDGFVDSTLDTDQQVAPGGPPLLTAHNDVLDRQLQKLKADENVFNEQLNAAMGTEVVVRQALERQLKAIGDEIRHTEQQIANLRLDSPREGTWIAPDAKRLEGAFIRRGQPIGEVIDFEDMIIRAVVSNELAPRLEQEVGVEGEVDVRVSGRPAIRFSGTIEWISDSGQYQLPSPSLGIGAGGPVMIDPTDQNGTKTVEQFFEVRVKDLVYEDGRRLEQTGDIFLRQRVYLRVAAGHRPWAVQWWRRIRQLVQRRFHTAI